MTLLECCSKLDSSTRFYKYNQFTIHYKKISHALEELKSIYSSQLVEIMTEMLSHDQHSRPDFRYLCGWLDTKGGNTGGVSCLMLDERRSVSVSVTTE